MRFRQKEKRRRQNRKGSRRTTAAAAEEEVTACELATHAPNHHPTWHCSVKLHFGLRVYWASTALSSSYSLSLPCTAFPSLIRDTQAHAQQHKSSQTHTHRLAQLSHSGTLLHVCPPGAAANTRGGWIKEEKKERVHRRTTKKRRTLPQSPLAGVARVRACKRVQPHACTTRRKAGPAEEDGAAPRSGRERRS